MKLRFPAALFGVLVICSASYGQVAQAISASIIEDDANIFHLINVTLTPSSTVHQPRTIDTRSQYWHSVLYPTNFPTQTMATHDYRGRVRVKWIGTNKPDPTVEYTAVFEVWSARQGWLSINLVKPTPQPAKAITMHTVLLNSYVQACQLNGSVTDVGQATPYIGNDPNRESDCFTLPLPWVNSQYWHDMGEYASAATFEEGQDGQWYADIDCVGLTAFEEDDSGYGSTFALPDAGTVLYKTRIIYRLIEVADQPVLE
jgi:hypothetical protein